MKQLRTLFLLTLLLVSFFKGFGQSPDTSICLKKVDSLIEISRSLSKEKKYDEAYKTVETAEAISVQCVGKDHLAYANCIFNRGRVFHLQNKYQEALPFYQSAREMRGKLPEHLARRRRVQPDHGQPHGRSKPKLHLLQPRIKL